MWVHMRTRTCTCGHTRARARARTCTRTRTQAYSRTLTHAHEHTQAHASTRKHTQAHARTRAYDTQMRGRAFISGGVLNLAHCAQIRTPRYIISLYIYHMYIHMHAYLLKFALSAI